MSVSKFFLFAVIAGIAAAGCERRGGGESAAEAKPKVQAKGVPVMVSKASRFKEGGFIEATGTLFSDQDTTIMANAGGYVVRITAEEGQLVRKGEPLAVLDQSDYQLGLAASQHQLEAAQLALKQAEIDFERMKQLFDSKSIPEAQFEGIKLKLDLTRNQVKLVNDGLDMAKKRLDDTIVRAPFDCYVVNRMVSVGAKIVTMPPTAMFRVIDLENLSFKTFLPEAELRRVKEGDRADIRFDSIGKDVSVNVDRVVRSVDPRSMTFAVVAKLSNRKFDRQLQPGLLGTAKIMSGDLEVGYVLERSVLRPIEGRAGSAMAFVAQDGKAASRVLEVESVDAVRYRVKSGLRDDDDLIITGTAQLSDGAEIIVTERVK